MKVKDLLFSKKNVLICFFAVISITLFSVLTSCDKKGTLPPPVEQGSNVKPPKPGEEEIPSDSPDSDITPPDLDGDGVPDIEIPPVGELPDLDSNGFPDPPEMILVTTGEEDYTHIDIDAVTRCYVVNITDNNKVYLIESLTNASPEIKLIKGQNNFLAISGSYKKIAFLKTNFLAVLGTLSNEMTNLNDLFSRFTALKYVDPKLFSKVTNALYFDKVFLSCSALETIPANLFYTNTSARMFKNCFEGCTKLKNIGENLFPENLTSNINSQCFDKTFEGVENLTSQSVANILKSLDNTGVSSQKLDLSANLACFNDESIASEESLKTKGWNIERTTETCATEETGNLMTLHFTESTEEVAFVFENFSEKAYIKMSSLGKMMLSSIFPDGQGSLQLSSSDDKIEIYGDYTGFQVFSHTLKKVTGLAPSTLTNASLMFLNCKSLEEIPDNFIQKLEENQPNVIYTNHQESMLDGCIALLPSVKENILQQFKDYVTIEGDQPLVINWYKSITCETIRTVALEQQLRSKKINVFINSNLCE